MINWIIFSIDHTLRLFYNMRFHIVFIFLYIVASGTTFGQDNGADLKKAADAALQKMSYQEAIGLYEDAFAAYEDQQNNGGAVECTIGIGQCQIALGRFTEATETLESGTNRYKDDQQVSPQGRAMLYKLLGEAYLNNGLNQQALAVLNQSEQLITNKDDLFYAELMEEIGVAYWNSGNDQLATQYHQLALQKRNDLLEEGHELIADSYINLGLVTMGDDYLNTFTYFNKALTIYEKQFGENHLKVANAYFNLGLADLENGTYTQATRYFEKVEAIYAVIYQQNHPNMAIIEAILGRVDYELEKYDEAIAKFNEALRIYKEIHGDKHPEIADTYGRLGEVYRDKEDYKNAIKMYQQAIFANLRDQNPSSDKSLPRLEKYFNADYLLRFLQAKAIALEELHYNKSLKPKDINAAISTYILCDSLISKIKQIRLNEEDKIKMSAISNEIYEDGIRISIDIAEKSMSKKQYHELAYQFFERSKASTLHEAINDTQAKNFAGIPAAVLQQETTLINDIVVLENKLNDQNLEAEQENQLSEELFEKNRQYRSFIQSLEQDYPDYYELKYKSSLASSRQIQAMLAENEAIISYFVSFEGESDEIGRLYIMSLGAQKMDFYRVNLDKKFFNQIRGFRNAIKFKSDKAIRKIGKNLFQLFFPRELYERYDFFTIIPDGALGTIPFEALLDESGQYVIETKNINYDFSANLYYENLKKAGNEGKRILAMAPEKFDSYESVRLNTLPGTIREVRQLERISKSSPYKVDVQTNELASEGRFKTTALQDYSIIHLATHGEVNESEPNLSRIFLYNSDRDEDDGFLYSSEIYNLKLNADLVTLSACETGLGKVAKGEGIIGLSRSLKYAGSKNLIVSLWQVADQSTSDLMISFYEKVQTGDSAYRSALRDAKLSLLYSDNYSSPYYWAPFILIGK